MMKLNDSILPILSNICHDESLNITLFTIWCYWLWYPCISYKRITCGWHRFEDFYYWVQFIWNLQWQFFLWKFGKAWKFITNMWDQEMDLNSVRLAHKACDSRDITCIPIDVKYLWLICQLHEIWIYCHNLGNSLLYLSSNYFLIVDICGKWINYHDGFSKLVWFDYHFVCVFFLGTKKDYKQNILNHWNRKTLLSHY